MTEQLVLSAGEHELQAVSLDGTRVRTLVAGLDELPDGIVVGQRRGMFTGRTWALPIRVVTRPTQRRSGVALDFASTGKALGTQK